MKPTSSCHIFLVTNRLVSLHIHGPSTNINVIAEGNSKETCKLMKQMLCWFWQNKISMNLHKTLLNNNLKVTQQLVQS
jgi:hypothetical protein